MIYPADFEEITGFGQVRTMLHAICRYDSSRAMAAALQMHFEKSEIEHSYNLIDEWRLLTDLFPTAAAASGSSDITPWLKSLDIDNFYFDEEELAAILEIIDAFGTLLITLAKKKELFPLLSGLLGQPDGIGQVKDTIRGTIDNKSKILPYATAEYGKLGSEIERLEKETRNVVHSIFKTWREAGYTAETDITVREERLVIPLLAEHKRKVQGFVKDISATGKIIYIEPLESLELNNRLTELVAERRRERERILRNTTLKLRPYKYALELTMQALAQLDLVRAKYDLSNKFKAQRPQVSESPVLHLKQAYNPLLWLKHKATKKEVIPMNLELDAENRILIISGPNAGGKSISLKTAILLQYMAQCGLFIPALPESKVGVFRNISIDCGDGQSLEDGLSTFSAHLQHLRKMSSISSKSSLFAIDELGDGTDPRFGGPIAQAVLEELLSSNALGIVTTHYSRLKEWAGQTKGVLNGSMAYDTKELKPLYRLETGKPGSSFALELMRKTGFEDRVINRVKTLSGEESTQTEDLLVELSAKQQELTELLDENKHKQAQLELLLSEYSALKEKINSKKKEILEGAKNKAADLLKEANKQIELTIRTIREHGAQPQKTKVVREKLDAFKQNKVDKIGVQKTTVNEPDKILPVKKIKVEYRPGMWVKNALNDTKGEVLEVKKDKLLAAFGLLKMWVPFSEIEPILETKNKKTSNKVSGYDFVGRQAEFKTQLDLRGLSAEEALAKVQKWLDEAYALGQSHLKIVHGRGDGILRKSLRDYFKTLHFVKAWKSEHEEHGGDGCTLLELR
ncbi:MAG: Smr/MutS family protein [Bacteroidia bacterium]|nr:Smr/MutS family protein [Bacteroidia bacterium]